MFGIGFFPFRLGAKVGRAIDDPAEISLRAILGEAGDTKPNRIASAGSFDTGYFIIGNLAQAIGIADRATARRVSFKTASDRFDLRN